MLDGVATAPIACPVCGPASPRVICVHNYPGKPLASSPSAPDTRSGDAQASAVASTETVTNASPAAGAEDGDGYGQHLLDELRAENARLRERIEFNGDRPDPRAVALVGLIRELIDTCRLVGIRGLPERLEKALHAILIVHGDPTAPKPLGTITPRPYSVASPARLDGDATGRGA